VIKRLAILQSQSTTGCRRRFALIPGTAFGVLQSEEDIYQALHVLKQAINRLVGEKS
jgi:hypothetical protein